MKEPYASVPLATPYMKNTLILVRGLPGSGKSTLAKQIGIGKKQGSDVKICDLEFAHYEADQYFMNTQGIYLFKPELIGDAHHWCQSMTKRSMENSTPTIVVSNTFSQQWEVDPYVELAIDNDYLVSIIQCQNTWRSTHDVPEEAIRAMKDRWEFVDGRKDRLLEGAQE
jgi:hypothetical protein